MDGFEILDPRFRSCVLPNTPLVKLGDGFAWLEGAVRFPHQDCLLVSDLPNDRTMRWSADGGISVFRQPSGFANGHTRDLQGRLIGCLHRHRCLTRTEIDGAITILADRYTGKRLNSPNDVICRSDGAILMEASGSLLM
jgi:gluconolactonase